MFRLSWLLIFSILFAASACGSRQAKEDPNAIKPGVITSGKSVTFVYQADDPSIKSVALTGDFNNWNMSGIPMNPIQGFFTLTLTLEYGIYQYKYIINGTNQVEDPYSEAYAPDGRNGRNSIVEVKK